MFAVGFPEAAVGPTFTVERLCVVCKMGEGISIVRVPFVYGGWPIIFVDESKLRESQLVPGCCSFEGTCKFQGADLAQDFDLEDMRMGTFSNVLEEFHLLGTLKVKRLQLGTVAVRERYQVGGRLRPVWIHGEVGEA